MNKNIKNINQKQSFTKSLDNKSTSLTQIYSPIYRKVPNFHNQKIIENSFRNIYNNEKQLIIDQKNKDQFKSLDIGIDSALKTPKSPLKSPKSIPLIDLNISTKIPEFDDKLVSKKTPSLSRQNSISQYASLPGLTNLKLRKQLTSKSIYRQQSMSQQQFKLQIRDYFHQLNTIIQQTSSHFQKRMKTHQDELLKIMMIQIKRVNKQCQKTIIKYNQLLKHKNQNQQINQIRLQTSFFRNQAIQLKKQNQELKKQIKYLKRLNAEYQIKIKNDSDTLVKMGEKLLNYKEKNKLMRKNMLDQTLILKKNEKIINSNQQTKIHLNLSTNQGTAMQGSKIVSLTKNNSKSLDQSIHHKNMNSVQKSLKSIKIKTQLASHTSSNNSLRNSLLVKLNKQINKKYTISKEVQQFCSQTPSKHIKTQQQQDQHYLPQIDQKYRNNQSQVNRDKIIKFLKQARPSIKSIIQKKKSSLNQKTNKKISSNQNQQQNTQKYFDKIKIIKNKVKLSTFEQQRWQQIKNNAIQFCVEYQSIHKDQQN